MMSPGKSDRLSDALAFGRAWADFHREVPGMTGAHASRAFEWVWCNKHKYVGESGQGSPEVLGEGNE